MHVRSTISTMVAVVSVVLIAAASSETATAMRQDARWHAPLCTALAPDRNLAVRAHPACVISSVSPAATEHNAGSRVPRCTALAPDRNPAVRAHPACMIPTGGS
jgi:hypothetical protein